MAKQKHGVGQRTAMAEQIFEQLTELLKLVAPANSTKAHTLANEILEEVAKLDAFRSEKEAKKELEEINSGVFNLLPRRPAQ